MKAKRKSKDVAADMRNTLREDLGALGGILGGFGTALADALAPSAEEDAKRPRLSKEERADLSNNDVARAARRLKPELDRVDAKAGKSVAAKKTKKRIGPERE